MPIPDPVFRAVIQNGIIKIDEQHMKAFLALKERYEGKQVQVILRLPDRKPSHSSHKYYRGVCLPILSKETGHVELEMHQILKENLLLVDVERPELGTRSTADLSESEFSEFIEGVKRYSAFCGVVLPEPGEVEPRKGY